MVIFGTIGIFRRYIPLSSGLIAFSRGVIGFIFLLAYLHISKKPFSPKKAKKSFLVLCVSGAVMGFNWILLFEAYNYTSVATATLCYYMAPVFVIFASPFVFGEKIGTKKFLCVFGAVIGMFFVSGIFENGFGGIGEPKGILFGISAAVLLPYIAFTEDFSAIKIEPKALVFLLITGIVHTGIAYALYFGSICELPAQTTAIFSYIDPVAAIILSAVFLDEKLGFSGAAGAFFDPRKRIFK